MGPYFIRLKFYFLDLTHYGFLADSEWKYVSILGTYD